MLLQSNVSMAAWPLHSYTAALGSLPSCSQQMILLTASMQGLWIMSPIARGGWSFFIESQTFCSPQIVRSFFIFFLGAQKFVFSTHLFLLLLLFVHQELIIRGARLLVKWRLKRSNRQTGSLPFTRFLECSWQRSASCAGWTNPCCNQSKRA